MLKPEHIRAMRKNGFPPEMVLNSFVADNLSKGTVLAERQHVLSLNTDISSLFQVVIEGQVLDERNYSVRLVLDLEKQRANSQCGCNQASQCQHAVALLVDYLTDKSQQQISQTGTIKKPSKIELWLADLNSSPSESDQLRDMAYAQSDASVAPKKLIYLLSQTQKSSGTLSLGLRKAALLKKGGYGQGYRCSLDEALQSPMESGLSLEAIDRDIINLLAKSSSAEQFGRQLSLSGRVGVIALNMLLESGRLFWHSGENLPLKMANKREVSFDWHLDNQNYHLQQHSVHPFQDWFVLDQLYYVDALKGQIGPIDHAGLSITQVLTLFEAPAIPMAQASLVSERLLGILPDSEVPLPDPDMNPAVINQEGLFFSPQLTLWSQENQNPLLQDLLPRTQLAAISWHYGDHKIPPNHPLEALTQYDADRGVRLRFERDIIHEKAALTQFLDYGFTPLDGSLDGPSAVPTHSQVFQLTGDNPSLIAMRWQHFLEAGIEALEDDGWHVEHDDSFDLSFSTVDTFEASIESENSHWFTLSVGFEVDGEKINLLPLILDLLGQMNHPGELQKLLSSQKHLLVPSQKGHWLKLAADRIHSVLDTLIELYDPKSLDKQGRIRLSRFHAANLNGLLNNPGLRWKGAEELRLLSEKIQTFEGIEAAEIPANVLAELRPYQSQGVAWLQFLREFGFNGVLADDMGLGKTLQTLVHLQIEKNAGRLAYPVLILAPTSLMSNWRKEIERFTPDLSAMVLHGQNRHKQFKQIDQFDIVLSTYPLVLRDEAVHKVREYSMVVLDEAQMIKNARSKTAQVIYNLQSQHRVCLTGTPMENHLGELWSMFHFLMPGFLGPMDRFKKIFRQPIETEQNSDRQKLLRGRLAPFMLRRTKETVALELPPKTEIVRTVSLEGEQRDLYESVRLSMDKKVREGIKERGLARSHIMILDALLKLRQVCCDPRLVKLERAQGLLQSAKLDLLLDLLDELVAENRKVLVFSQFTSMLSLIEELMKERAYRYSLLTGKTRDRESAINAFQEGNANVFLISLKAGGTGLNLTAADTVIHYDPWWNPAVEQQATDRAYRIGQDKPVFVYKLLTEDTVEEKILDLQSRKQSLADGLYTEQGEDTLPLNSDELMHLLEPLDGALSE